MMRYLMLTLLLLPSLAWAQTATGNFRDWQTFTVSQNGQKICYMASFPKKSGGNFKSRGKPYMLVTTRRGHAPEVSVSSGYPYQGASVVQGNVDGKQNLTFFTTQDTPNIAWLKDSASDKAVIALMKKGTYLSAKGMSKLGTHSTDRFSLLGFTKAYNTIAKNCR